jgi:hypothetical protein
MSKKNAIDSSRLDLGIQSLLASVESSVSSVELPTSRKIVSEMNGATHNLCDSEFAMYAKRSQWEELIEHAEKVIAETDSPLARVWWLRGQVEMSSMPVSLLVSSFGSLCQRIQQQGKMESCSDSLVELSYLISERARLNHDAQCLRELDEILIIFELSHTGDQPATDPAVQQASLDALKRQGENRFSSSVKPMLSRGRIIVGVFLSVAVLLAMFGSVRFSSRLFRNENRSALIVLTDKKNRSQFSSPTLDLPDISKRIGISDLDAVKYRLNSADANANPGGAVLQESRSDAKPQIRPQVEIGTAPRRTAGVSKESVNTTGPLEGREFRRGVERERSKAIVKAQLPHTRDDSRGQWPSPFGARSMVVVDATKVFRRMSDTSDILGQLLVGDKILVEGTYGRWARIRSRKGRTGYVDVGSLGQGEDFRAP